MKKTLRQAAVLLMCAALVFAAAPAMLPVQADGVVARVSVNGGAWQSFDTLQAAIDAVPAGEGSAETNLIQLLENVTMEYSEDPEPHYSDSAEVGEGRLFTLNGLGNTIARGEGNSRPLMTVGSGCEIIITELTFDGGSADGAAAEGNGGCIYISGKAQIKLDSGAKLQNSRAARGGAVYINGVNERNGSETVFTVGSGASIRGCEAEQGGAVFVSEANLTVLGELSGNTAEQGGAVYAAHGLWQSSRMTVEGGASISGNTAEQGGAVYLAGQNALRIGGTAELSSNSAGAEGGTVYADSSAIYLAGETKLTSSSAGANGAAIFCKGDLHVRRGYLSLADAALIERAAGDAAVYMGVRSDMYMTGGSAIRGSLGDGVYLESPLHMSGSASVEGCEGVGVYCHSTVSLMGAVRVCGNGLSDIYVKNDSEAATQIIMAGDLTAGAHKIGVTVSNDNPATEGTQFGVTQNPSFSGVDTFFSRTNELTIADADRDHLYWVRDRSFSVVKYPAPSDDRTSVDPEEKRQNVTTGSMITLDPNGGELRGELCGISLSGKDPVDVEVTGDCQIPDPYRAAYDFIGWQKEPGAGGEGYVFTAQWRLSAISAADESGVAMDVLKVLRWHGMGSSAENGGTLEPKENGYDPDMLGGVIMPVAGVEPIPYTEGSAAAVRALLAVAVYERYTQDGFVPVNAQTTSEGELLIGSDGVNYLQIKEEEGADGNIRLAIKMLSTAAIRITFPGGSELLTVVPGDVNFDRNMNANDWGMIMRWTLSALRDDENAGHDDVKINGTEYDLWALMADMTGTELTGKRTDMVNAVDWVTIMQLTLQAWKSGS